MSRRSPLAPLLLASMTFGVACSDPAPAGVLDDAGVTVDTGSIVDAGLSADRGMSADTGVTVDADAVVVDVPDATPFDTDSADVSRGDAPLAMDLPSPTDAAVEAGAEDAGAADATAMDAGSPDAASLDAGPPDSGASDASTRDAAVTDAGSMNMRRFGEASGWVVPRNGHGDGFYTAAIGEGTRWWSLLDLDGDRRPDLVQTGDPTRSGGYVFDANTPMSAWRVFLNTGASFSTAATTWPVPNAGHADGPYTTAIGAGTRWWSTFDIDGDRRPDLVQTGDPTRSGGYVFDANTPMSSWRVFLNTGTGFVRTAIPWPVPSAGHADGPYTTAIGAGTRWWVTLDLNGDGLADFVQTGDPTRSGGYVFGTGTATHTWRVSLGR